MRNLVLAKVGVCLVVLGAVFYHSIDAQNELTQMRMQIPLLAKQIKALQEEGEHLQYEIAAFESPQHLIELSRQDAYAHLKHPFSSDVLALLEGKAIFENELEEKTLYLNPRLPLATGAHR